MALIIAGWAGVGKTELAKKYPNTVIDLESSSYKWMEGGNEESKGSAGRTLNPDYPNNYICAILEASRQFKIVCVALHQDIQKELNIINLKYLYVFAHSNDKQIYLDRYKKRGNTPAFYYRIDELWEYMETLKRSTKNQYVVLKENSTLEEFLLETSDILKERKSPIIVSGIAGIGKTTLAKKHLDKVIDFESTIWKWIGGGSEETKGVLGLDRNTEYPENYICEIEKEICNYKVICVSLHKEIQSLMRERGMPYIYVFPCYWDKEEYASRYRERGNTSYFVERVTNNWDIILTLQLESDSHIIVLGTEENLEEYLKQTTLLFEDPKGSD